MFKFVHDRPLSANIRLGCMWLTLANTLTYYSSELIKAVKVLWNKPLNFPHWNNIFLFSILKNYLKLVFHNIYFNHHLGILARLVRVIKLVRLWVKKSMSNICSFNLRAMLFEVKVIGAPLWPSPSIFDSTVNEWMSAWVHEWMSEWVNEWMSAWVNEWMSEWVNECMSAWVHEWMGEWVNEWMSEWVNEWMSDAISRWKYSSVVYKKLSQ